MIVVTGVNMASKRAVLKKSNDVTNFNDRKGGFYLNKTLDYGVFLSQRSPRIVPNANRKFMENIDVQVAQAFLFSKLALTLHNDSHELFAIFFYVIKQIQCQ